MALDRYTDKPYAVIALLTVGYISVAIYFCVFLQFNFLKGDVLDYWKDSLAWETPFHPFHVPVYPLMIALLRGITFGVLSPAAIMMSINFASFLVGALLIYRIIRLNGAKQEYAALGALLFGFWPFVGVTYAVNPQADLPAIVFFLAGLYFLQRECRLRAAIFLGLAIVTHKAMWPFIALLIAADCFYRKVYFSIQNIVFAVLMLLPLAVLWFAGSFHHHSYTWLWDSNLQNELASTSSNSLPVLDGLLGPFIFEGVIGGMKGLLLMGFVVLSIVAIFFSFKFKGQASSWYGGAIAVAVLLLFVVLNHFEIWAAARFSRLLVIPLMVGVSKIERSSLLAHYGTGAIAVLLLFFLSQFAYAWYMARVFFE